MIQALRRAAARMEAWKRLSLPELQEQLREYFSGETQTLPGNSGFLLRHPDGWQLEFRTRAGNLPLPHCVVRCPGAADTRFVLSPGRGWFLRLARLLWLRSTPSGDPAFDRDFILRTADAGAARAWLNDERRAVLRELLDLPDSGHTHLTVNPQGITLEQHGIISVERLPLYRRWLEAARRR